MTMEGIRHEPAHRRRRIVVGAQEIPHINEDAEVRVIDSGDELLHPDTVLAEAAVVFHHGLDTLVGSVLG